MILRRITEHVKAQNWFAVGLDFFIVVVGVFIGIQLGNWNESRSDQRRADNYVERLKQDMTNNLEVLEGREETYASQTEYGLFAVNAMSEPENREEAWEIIRAYFQASHVFTITLQRGTYDEIISSGHLALLDDQDLVDALSEFYAFGGFATIADIPVYRENLRRIVPYELKRYFQTQCYKIIPVDTHVLFDCPPPDSPVDLVALATELVSDTELKRDLQYMLGYAGVSADIARNRTGRVEHVLSVLSKR